MGATRWVQERVAVRSVPGHPQRKETHAGDLLHLESALILSWSIEQSLSSLCILVVAACDS